jgi:hypothetical protein
MTDREIDEMVEEIIIQKTTVSSDKIEMRNIVRYHIEQSILHTEIPAQPEEVFPRMEINSFGIINETTGKNDLYEVRVDGVFCNNVKIGEPCS